MRNTLKRIIAPSQVAFALCRWIHENELLAQEQISMVRKKRGKRGLIELKLDMSKAYDKVEWPFILIVLHLFGFSKVLIHWVL